MSDESNRLRELSNAAFGQSYRLELMLAVLAMPGGIVSLTELSRLLPSIPLSSLQRPFESLVHCGLLTALPRGESRYRHFMLNPSHAWDWAMELEGLAKLDSESYVPF